VILSIQTYGRTCNYHPHLHLLVSDGGFDRQGTFYAMPYVDTHPMEALFRHKVLRMLLAKNKIAAARVEMLLSWRHSGFSIHRSAEVEPTDHTGRETVAAYLLHAPISHQRMRYDPSAATVYYQVSAPPPSGATLAAEAGPQQTWTALDRMAALTSHIPNRWEQTVRYYGHYSNKSRGQRKASRNGYSISPQVSHPSCQPEATETADAELEEFRKACRRNWARLIKKVYEVDPLVCPKCAGPMDMISFIEDPKVIKTILVHVQIWERPARPPPPTVSSPETICNCGFFDDLVS